MKTFFIPNARFWALLLIVVGLLLMTTPVFAQDAPPEVPDLTPVIDDLSNQLDNFLTSAAIIMGVLAFLTTQGLKFVFPNTTVKAETIYGGVVFVFTAIFFLATLANAGEQLGKAVQIGTVLAETLKAILAMLVIPTAAYNYFEKRGNPVAGGHQSSKAFQLEAPKPHAKSTTADINISATSTPADVRG